MKQAKLKTELKQLLNLALPLMASQSVQGCSGFIATLIVAHLGKDQLAATALVSVSWITLVVLIFGILNAIAPLVAQQVGAHHFKEVNKLVAQALYLAVILAIPVMVGMYFEPLLLKITGQSPALLRYATAYLHTLLWCMLPLSIIIVFEQFLVGIGRTKLVLFISLIQIPFEIFANYSFTYGLFGFHGLGIAGLGYGYTLVFSVAAILIAIYIAKSRVHKKYPIFHYLKTWNNKYLVKIFQVGWPIGLMYGTELAYFTVIAFAMGRFGLNALAAHQIASQFLGVTISCIFGLSQATSARVGFAVGKGCRDTIKLAIKAGFIIGVSLMFIVAMFYWLMPYALISLDQTKSLGEPAIALAATFLGILGIFQILDGFRLTAIGALRGLNDTKIPMIYSMIAFSGLGLLSAWFFAFVLGMKGAGLWWGITFGDLICAVILIMRFYRKAKSVDLDKLVSR